MSISAVAAISLAVFTDLSILELEKAQPIAEVSQTETAPLVAEAVDTAQDAETPVNANASIWSKDAVNKNRVRN